MPERVDARILIHGPSSGILVQELQDIDLREYKRMRARYRVAAIPVHEGPGMYYFEVDVWRTRSDKWEPVARIPVEVVVPPSTIAGRR